MDINSIYDTIKSNQFFQGGFVIATMAALLAYAKSIPSKLTDLFIKHCTVNITFTNEDLIFKWFIEWLDKQPFTHSKTELKLTSPTTNDKEKFKPIYSLGDASFLVSIEGLHAVIKRDRQGTSADPNGHPSAQREFFSIRILRWKRKQIYSLFSNIYKEISKTNDNKVALLTESFDDRWQNSAYQNKRPISSVVLKKGVMEDLINDIANFHKDEQWYLERGQPYQRGYCLEGLTGTGKTSLIMAIAGHFDMKIHQLKLNNSHDDSGLLSLLSKTDKESLVVIEDIDCIFNGREAVSKEAEYTFSGLLNAINGLSSSTGRLLFITTNHIEKLDSALIRRGRIDRIINFGTVDHHQAKGIFLTFFKDEEELAIKFADKCVDKNLTPAALQEHLLGYRLNASEAVEKFNG